MKANFKNYVKERNEMLKKCDVNEYRKFVNAHKEYYSEMVIRTINAAPDEVLAISLHQMIFNVRTLPKKLREDSAQWILAHGYKLTILGNGWGDNL